MMKISTSFLSSEGSITDTIKKIEKTDTDYIHVDIMDGKFVSEKTFSFSEIKKISTYTTKPLDVHLMVANPSKYINDYAMLDTEYLTFHYEAVKDVRKVIEAVKMTGIRCGLSINPETGVKDIYPFLSDLDLVLVMSVEPGKGGQKFIDNTLEKISNLKEEIINQGLLTKIEVDGGINKETAYSCREAGADILVSGSFITNEESYQKQIDLLR